MNFTMSSHIEFVDIKEDSDEEEEFIDEEYDADEEEEEEEELIDEEYGVHCENESTSQNIPLEYVKREIKMEPDHNVEHQTSHLGSIRHIKSEIDGSVPTAVEEHDPLSLEVVRPTHDAQVMHSDISNVATTIDTHVDDKTGIIQSTIQDSKNDPTLLSAVETLSMCTTVLNEVDNNGSGQIPRLTSDREVHAEEVLLDERVSPPTTRYVFFLSL